MVICFDPQKGILEIKPNEDFKGRESLEHAKENINTGFQMCGNNLKAVIAEMPSHYINAEVTLFYKKNVPNVPLAMIANSSFKVMIGNFLLSLGRPERPTALFKNHEDALEWVNQMIIK